MIRRPPRSTLFPYRRSSDLTYDVVLEILRANAIAHEVRPVAESELRSAEEIWRSEEHTSELQSRLHLVCRLLLEKKKNKKYSEKGEQMSNDTQTLSSSVRND